MLTPTSHVTYPYGLLKQLRLEKNGPGVLTSLQFLCLKLRVYKGYVTDKDLISKLKELHTQKGKPLNAVEASRLKKKLIKHKLLTPVYAKDKLVGYQLLGQKPFVSRYQLAPGEALHKGYLKLTPQTGYHLFQPQELLNSIYLIEELSLSAEKQQAQQVRFGQKVPEIQALANEYNSLNAKINKVETEYLLAKKTYQVEGEKVKALFHQWNPDVYDPSSNEDYHKFYFWRMITEQLAYCVPTRDLFYTKLLEFETGKTYRLIRHSWKRAAEALAQFPKLANHHAVGAWLVSYVNYHKTKEEYKKQLRHPSTKRAIEIIAYLKAKYPSLEKCPARPLRLAPRSRPLSLQLQDAYNQHKGPNYVMGVSEYGNRVGLSKTQASRVLKETGELFGIQRKKRAVVIGRQSDARGWRQELETSEAYTPTDWLNMHAKNYCLFSGFTSVKDRQNFDMVKKRGLWSRTTEALAELGHKCYLDREVTVYRRLKSTHYIPKIDAYFFALSPTNQFIQKQRFVALLNQAKGLTFDVNTLFDKLILPKNGKSI